MGSNLGSQTEQQTNNGSPNGARSNLASGPTAGAIIYLNSSATQILGRESIQMVGRTVADFAHPNDTAELSVTAKAALGYPGMAVSAQIRLRRDDESEVVCELVSRATNDSEGSVILVTIPRDVTERLAAERSLRHAQQTAPEALSDRTLAAECERELR